MKRVIMALLVTALCAISQQAPPPAPAAGSAPGSSPGSSPTVASDGSVTFRTNTQLVVETVSVIDKNGKPVEGLTAKDFAITEDGAAQTIQFCEFQKLADTPDAGDAPLPPVRPAMKTQIAPEPPGDIRYKDRRLIVMYLDMTSMPMPDQLRSLDAASKFIKTKMTGPDLLSIMEYNGTAVKVLNDFTDDRDELMKTINTLIVGEGNGFDANGNDDSTADTGSAFGQDDAEFSIFNTDRQLAALQTAVRMLAGLNEKKAFVYFASGLRLNGTNNQAQLQATVNSAIRGNVAFYPIDARGLVATPPLGGGSPGGVGMYSGSSAMAVTGNLQSSQDTLYSLAADTGGKALLDYNDLTMGVVNAQHAITSYYIIGYYTTKTTLDGKFRRIKIAYAGDASAKLSYRQGYYAGKTFAKFNSTDKEQQLSDALALGDPITDLTIAMEADFFQLNRAEYYIPVSLKIPGSELALARRGGAEHTVIDFIGEVKDDYGATITNVRDKVDVKLTGKTAAELAKSPILYSTGFTLLPGTYNIKVLARDDETGRIGTYLLKFVVPNLNKVDKRIPISSVVLGSQRIDQRDVLFNAAKDKGKAEEVNPLVQDGQKLLPSVTRVFSRSKDMYIYLQAYEPTATETQPLVAFVTFYRGQTKAFETAPLSVTEGLPNKLKTIPMKFDLALDKLLPGRYNCQVTVLDPAGKKAAFWQAPVMLVP